MEKESFIRTHRRHAHTALAAAVALGILAYKSQAATPITLTWDSSTGDWFDSTHWSPSAVPNNTVDNTSAPVIPGGTVTLGANATVSGLSLGAPATLLFSPGVELNVLTSPGYSLAGNLFLDSSAVLNLQGPGSLTALTATGPGSISLIGGVTFAGASQVGNLSFLPSTILGTGSVEITQTLDATGTVLFSSLGNVTLTLDSGATGQIASDLAFTPAAFINNGSVTSSASALVNVRNSGFLAMTGTSSLSNYSGSASSTLSISSTLLSGTGSFTSAGAVLLDNATLNLGGYTQPILGGSVVLGGASRLNFAQLRLLDGASITGSGTLTSNPSATLQLYGNATVQKAALNNIIGMYASANASLHITGLASDGLGAPFTISAASVVVDPDALLQLYSSGIGTLTAGSLINNGSLLAASTLVIGSGGSLINNALMLTASEQILASSTAASFTNTGLLTNFTTSLSSATFIQTAINNSGTISGFFTLSGGGVSSGIISPDIPGSPNLIRSINLSSSFTLTNGASLTSSAGTITVGGITIPSGIVNADHVNLAGASNDNVLDGPGTLVLSGPNTWSSGNMSGSGETYISPAGTLTLQSQLGLGTITDRTLWNAGIIAPFSNSLAPLFALQGTANIVNSGTLTLPALEIATTPFTNIPSTNSFLNQGVVLAGPSAFPNLMAIDIPFFNTGTLTVTGATQLYVASGSGSGMFNAPAHAYVSLGNGYSNGYPTVSSPYVLNNATLTGAGTFDGSVQLAGNSTVDNGAFDLITGPGTLTVTKSLLIPASPYGYTSINGHATVQILSGGTLTIGSNMTNGTVTLDGSTIVNQGIFDADLQSVPSISLLFKNGASIQNAGVFVLNSSDRVFAHNTPFLSDSNPDNAFINTGTLTLNGGGVQASSVAVPVYNAGQVIVNTGYTSFDAGGSASGLFSAASTSFSSNGTLFFTAPYTLDGATFLSLNPFPFASTDAAPFVADAPLTIHGVVSAAGLSIEAGLNGSGTLTGSGNFWGGGTISNTTLLVAGTLTTGGAGRAPGFSPSSQFQIGTAGIKSLDGATLLLSSETSDVWTHRLTDSLPPNDTIDLRNGASIINHGTFYSLLSESTIKNGDNNPNNLIYNDGVFGRGFYSFGSGDNVTTIGVPFHNAGLVYIQQGFIDFAGGYFPENNTAGQPGRMQFGKNAGLMLSGGAYDFGSPVDFTTAILKGAGTINGDVLTSGIISPGNSPGTLSIDGNLTLNSGAILQMELAGNTPALVDHLLVSGDADLANGSLTITLLNTFLPDPTDAFDILTARSFLSPFAPFPDGSRIPDTAGVGSFLVTYSENDLILSDFQPAPTPEPAAALLLLAALPPLLLRRQKRPAPASTI